MADRVTISEVLKSIAVSYSDKDSLADISNLLRPSESNEKFSRAIKEELSITVAPEEISTAGSISRLAAAIEPRLKRNKSGKNLVDIYRRVEQLAREEYHPKIPYSWCANWEDFSESWKLVYSS